MHVQIEIQSVPASCTIDKYNNQPLRSAFDQRFFLIVASSPICTSKNSHRTLAKDVFSPLLSPFPSTTSHQLVNIYSWWRDTVPHAILNNALCS